MRNMDWWDVGVVVFGVVTLVLAWQVHPLMLGSVACGVLALVCCLGSRRAEARKAEAGPNKDG